MHHMAVQRFTQKESMIRTGQPIDQTGVEAQRKDLFESSVTLLSVIAPLLGMVYAIVLLWNRMVDSADLALLAGMYVATAFGITVGYHRMLTHRSFEAHPAIRFVLLALGSMAVQGPANVWASTHIKHHATSDTDDDPHSPVAGFVHAHVGWILSLREVPDLERYGTWLKKDRLVTFMSRTMVVWVGLGLLIPYLLGGWTGLLWGGLVRIFLNNHVTWSVNSVCHTFGRRSFNTPDRSRNNWLVGLLAMGEGWHNNHHAFPRSAMHGLHWWQVDCSAYLIRALERVGLVWNVQRVSPERLALREVFPGNSLASQERNS